jgi:hypothetical protein
LQIIFCPNWQVKKITKIKPCSSYNELFDAVYFKFVDCLFAEKITIQTWVLIILTKINVSCFGRESAVNRVLPPSTL